MGGIELTAAEVKRREMRAMRFQTDIPTIKAVSVPKPKPHTMSLPGTVKNVDTKKKKKPYSIIQWDMEALSGNATTEIMGTSTALEKPYFRLTSVKSNL